VFRRKSDPAGCMKDGHETKLGPGGPGLTRSTQAGKVITGMV
jgi:hypothetical protein